MASKPFSFRRLALFLYRSFPKRLLRSPTNAQKKLRVSHSQSSFSQRSEPPSNEAYVFNVEGALLRSSSLFPYFMAVAFEAGSLIRALILFSLYPFISMLRKHMALKAMVFVGFVGLKRKNFRAGSAVLPKIFLDDVGLESFEYISRGKKKVGVSDLPQVMIENFLREYLEIDVVAGRELKEYRGYFLGLMEDRKKIVLDEISVDDDDNNACNAVGITCTSQDLDPLWFSACKEIKLVTEGYKRSWNLLPREKYPKPFVFHDGRLAFRPTPMDTLAMFIWLPFGLTISVFRILISFALPYNVGIPILVFSGIKLELTMPSIHRSESSDKSRSKGLLYVCNHRTLLDPLFLCFGLKKSMTAVTYSISRMSELLSPIRTIRLTRDRDEDAWRMKEMLSQSDLVVCPEGTTCREPYLLRFSPLFAELSDEIVPVAMECHVTMFYGTTAGGLKCMDPFFFLMNPRPSYSLRLLKSVRGLSKDNVGNRDDPKAKFAVANNVQKELGKSLGFTCTSLTRKEKYMMLAGNDGVV